MNNKCRLFGRRVGKKLRLHSSKPTLVTWAQHMRMDGQAVRLQGGWGKRGGEAMTDTYLRDEMAIVLEMTEQVVARARSGESSRDEKR